MNNIEINKAEPEIPNIGDTIRTKKMQMEGKVTKIGRYDWGSIAVYFETVDGRTMKTPLSNVTVIDILDDENIQEHIVKHGSGYRLLSHKGKNLGDFKTRAAAAKHEGEVEYFKKHTNEDINQKLKEFLDTSRGGGDDDDDDDKDHEESYYALTTIVGNAISQAFKDIDKHNKPGRFSFENTPKYKAKVRRDIKSLPMVRKLANLFLKNDKEAFKYFLTIPREVQEQLADMWEAHVPNWQEDLKNAQNSNEGMMGGINRSRPATDVSYQHVLDPEKTDEYTKIIGEFASNRDDDDNEWHGPFPSHNKAKMDAISSIGGGKEGFNFRIIQKIDGFYWDEYVPGCEYDEIHEQILKRYQEETQPERRSPEPQPEITQRQDNERKIKNIAQKLEIRTSDIPWLYKLLRNEVTFRELPQMVRMALYKIHDSLPYDSEDKTNPYLLDKLKRIVSEAKLQKEVNILYKKYKNIL